MSTANKLSPNVRRDRSARTELLQSMQTEIAQVIRTLPAGDARKPKVIAASHLLYKIAKDPARSGAEKQALFTRIAIELRGILKDVPSIHAE